MFINISTFCDVTPYILLDVSEESFALIFRNGKLINR
jgi:hypothetical protein